MRQKLMGHLARMQTLPTGLLILGKKEDTEGKKSWQRKQNNSSHYPTNPPPPLPYLKVLMHHYFGYQ